MLLLVSSFLTAWEWAHTLLKLSCPMRGTPRARGAWSSLSSDPTGGKPPHRWQAPLPGCCYPNPVPELEDRL